jgi:hypothetical protein
MMTMTNDSRARLDDFLGNHGELLMTMTHSIWAT